MSKGKIGIRSYKRCGRENIFTVKALNIERNLVFVFHIKAKKPFIIQFAAARHLNKNVHGIIDAVEDFQRNTFGKYLYSYREHNYENPAISLFIRTLHIILFARMRGIFAIRFSLPTKACSAPAANSCICVNLSPCV